MIRSSCFEAIRPGEAELRSRELLGGEIEGVVTTIASIGGPYSFEPEAGREAYTVLLLLRGGANVNFGGDEITLNGASVIRIPFGRAFRVEVPSGGEAHLLTITKRADPRDCEEISRQDHTSLYARALSDCPVYEEDIKSDKTVNRMILPEGMVPRFCMGWVLSEGPDSVAEHEHPMLDQLFLGLEGCRCTCSADAEEALLLQNCLLHIPLGSRHSVSVARDQLLSYIWMDFFLTLKGQAYMSEQHKMKEED